MKLPNTRMSLILAVASGVLLLTIALPSRGSQSTAELLPALPRVLEEHDTSADDAREQQLSEQRQRSERLSFGRDPFRAPVAVVTREPLPDSVYEVDTLPHLTGFCVGAHEALAIIDHDIVGPGDRLASGHRITAIGDGTVTLIKDGEELVLSLGDNR